MQTAIAKAWREKCPFGLKCMDVNELDRHLKHVDIMPGKVVESSNKNKFFFVILSIGLETGVYVRTQEA